jgi:hypothetical protein
VVTIEIAVVSEHLLSDEQSPVPFGVAYRRLSVLPPDPLPVLAPTHV